jgi:hypothetical protein
MLHVTRPVLVVKTHGDQNITTGFRVTLLPLKNPWNEEYFMHSRF